MIMKKHFYFSSSTEFFIPFYVSLLFCVCDTTEHDNMAQYVEDFFVKFIFNYHLL